MEYYSAVKSEMLNHTTAWMNLETLFRVEDVNHTRPHICFHLYEISRIDKSIETGTRLVVV